VRPLTEQRVALLTSAQLSMLRSGSAPLTAIYREDGRPEMDNNGAKRGHPAGGPRP